MKFKEEMDKFLRDSPVSTQVLFVDDGSEDASFEIIQDISLDPFYSFIQLDRNYGLSTALKAAFDHIDSRYMGYIDSDLQTSPMDFLKFIPYLDDYEMVNGIRAIRHDGLIKRWSSRVGNSIRRFIAKDNVVDTCCPLKMMKTESIKNIPFFKGMHRFIPALVLMQGGKLKQLPVRHFKRYAGKAKYNVWNRLTHPFLDTLAFYWIKKRKINYKVKVKSYSDNMKIHV